MTGFPKLRTVIRPGLCVATLEAGHTPLGTFDRHLAKLDGAQRL